MPEPVAGEKTQTAPRHEKAAERTKLTRSTSIFGLTCE